MKTKSFILLVYFQYIVFNSISQEVVEKSYFDTKNELGGDVVIKKSTIKVEGSVSYKIFEIESSDNGNYYLNAWLMGGELDNFGSGKFLEYDVTINHEKQADKLKPLKSNWHNVSFSDSKSQEKKLVQLKKGINLIIFSCNAPEIPDIEFIRLSKDKTKTEISESSYNQFVDQIKTEIQERIKNPKAKKDSLSSMHKSGVVLSNPEGNYYHHIGITFRYTTYKTYSFNSGQQVFFSTYASDGYEHVLEVFNSSNPEAYSWVALSNSSGLASININIPSTGTYYVRVRAYRQETQGLVDLNVNGQYYYADCPVSGSGFRHAHETPTTYNYFTCKLTGDSRIWIEDDSGIPGKIRAYNDDYSGGGGDFSWGLASRVKKDFSVRIGAALVSAYSSYNPTGTCDLYIMCQNSTIMSYFPNLKADDAIQSAPASNNYNCASWGGGMIDRGRYFWASNPPNSNNLSTNWYVAGNFWQSWDNFFGNNPLRYTGAPTYTRTGANSSNGEVAMWYNSTSYQYTHFSVVKPANDQPHGYDWESKPGGLMRTFHPRDALNDNSYYGYGSISLYYRRVNPSLKSYSLKESIELGLTVLPEVTLNMDEEELVQDLKANISQEDIALFNQKMKLLVDKANTPELIKQSNPFFLYETSEFKDMLDFCKKMGNVLWPLLFDKIFDDNNPDARDLSILLINETTPEYASLMEKVKEEWINNNYTPEGAYIAPSPIANTKNYVKKLLAVKVGETSTSVKQPMDNDNYNLFSVFPNPFKYQTTLEFNVAENNSVVSLKVLDINGKLLETVIINQKYDAGNWQVQWLAGNYKPGLYLFNLTINGKTFNRRFFIE